MTQPIETFDCAGCHGHCYGGYRMEADKDGYGDWVRKSDIVARLKATQETSIGLAFAQIAQLIAELDK